MIIKWLDPSDSNASFPPVKDALKIPDGLLAAGGDLNPQRLLEAYRQGIFPWYEEGQPILWWSPNPRAVLYPEHLKISRSLRKSLRRKFWKVSFDLAFRETVEACAAPRKLSNGTWITRPTLEAYCRLHTQGYGHSVEVRNEQDELVGGLYGLAIGKVFFGESMHSRQADASKVALVYLVRHLQHWGYPLIDCQLASPHLHSLGAETIPRHHFIKHLKKWCEIDSHPNPWSVDPDVTLFD